MSVTPSYGLQQVYDAIRTQPMRSTPFQVPRPFRAAPAEPHGQAPEPAASTQGSRNAASLLDLLNAQQGIYGQGTRTGSGAPGNMHADLVRYHVAPDPGVGLAGGNGDGSTSVMVSSNASPGGLQLDGGSAADLAREIMNTAGSNGVLSLSDVDQLPGVTKPETGAHSTEATVAQDWDKLTNGSGRMTVPQLTAALEAFFAARGNGAGV
ncbi:MAG: hypothetical protein V4578_16120 [Pseudomonadota bacterium]